MVGCARLGCKLALAWIAWWPGKIRTSWFVDRILVAAVVFHHSAVGRDVCHCPLGVLDACVIALGRWCRMLRGRARHRVSKELQNLFLEASIAVKVPHRNTVTIFDHGHTEDGTSLMVMESLGRRRQDNPPTPAGGGALELRCAHMALQICCLLREAHSLSETHRDLKPVNVLQ